MGSSYREHWSFETMDYHIDLEWPDFKCSNPHVYSATRREVYRQLARAKPKPIAFAVSLSSLGSRENLHKAKAKAKAAAAALQQHRIAAAKIAEC